MGVFRSFALIIVAVLLFISFLGLGTFATLDSSLDYNVVSSQVKIILNDSVNFTLISNYEDILNTSCLNSTIYNYSDGDYSFAIPCEVIANGTDAIIDYELDVLINESYYKDYNCSFFDCFKETNSPLFLISYHTQDYFNTKFYRFLFFSIILSGLVFILIDKKINFPFTIGLLLILSFIPVSLLDSIGTFLFKLILSSAKFAVSGISSLDLKSFCLIFFTQSNSVFLTGLSIGLILIAITFFLKLFKVGFKVGKLFMRKEKLVEKKVKPKKEVSNK